MMKVFILLVTIFFCFVEQKFVERSKRAYELTSGWKLLMNPFPLSPTFKCNTEGYFADIENKCQIYHVCQSSGDSNIQFQFIQHSFICGNGTVFNQLTFTCTRVEESIPCDLSPDFYYLNKRIGRPNTQFLTEEEIEHSYDFKGLMNFRRKEEEDDDILSDQTSGTQSRRLDPLIDHVLQLLNSRRL